MSRRRGSGSRWRAVAGRRPTGRSKTRTPVRLLPMPSLTFLRGRSAASKKAAISLASASESRTSPPTTTSGGKRVPRGLDELRLAVVDDDGGRELGGADAQPDDLLVPAVRRRRQRFRCFGARLAATARACQKRHASATQPSASRSSSRRGSLGLRRRLALKEMSFFRNSVIPLTVRLLRLGGRGGPREDGHRYAVRRRCVRAAPRTPRAGSSR